MNDFSRRILKQQDAFKADLIAGIRNPRGKGCSGCIVSIIVMTLILLLAFIFWPD